ncbi:putative 28S ribosomal protein S26, mitochondrial [Apostichopus japonicus]|uniref:Small ribosomal subunit protein mS26 n=1 Tax=Stichopus japonicus TaxID=307972 RepID=A0A2G8KS33_STIJA|nr:putative 28S ribosomal protein S26, mitochondrial [Apostichopus japonicus]
MFQTFKTSLCRFIPQCTNEPVLQTGCVYQTVRWRKRRTDPIAKSKIGRVRVPTPIDPAEYKFSLEKWDEYNILINAIRSHCIQDHRRKNKETAAGVSLVEQSRKDEEEWQKLLLWNTEENAKTRQLREARLREEAKREEEEKLEALIQIEKEEAAWLAELEELVKKEKEASKSYITLENLDENIEAALAEEKSYLFGIDKNGKFTLPENTAWTELKERLEQNERQQNEPQEKTETA